MTEFFPGPCGNLEGIIEKPRADVVGVAVLCHPHPLMGGNLRDPLIAKVAKQFHKAGVATLKFNFRSVGRSDGQHSGSLEYQDCLAALDQAMKEFPGVPRLLCGYSFGSLHALIAAHKLKAHDLHAVATIAFPIASEAFVSEDFEVLPPLPSSTLAFSFCGENDNYAPPEAVSSWMASRCPHAVCIPIAQADHFFRGSGYADELTQSLVTLVASSLPK